MDPQVNPVKYGTRSTVNNEWFHTGGSTFSPNFRFGCIDVRFDNFWSARNLNDLTALALTTTTISGSTITRSTVAFNTQYTTWVSSGCTDGNHPNVTYVARHEMGHKVRFVDVPNSDSHTTIMKPYSCTVNNSIKTSDSTEVKTIYP